MASDPKVDIFMPLYVGDFLADTLHLNTEQIGAFLLLLFHQWRKGHFAEDEIAQITRLAGSSNLSASSSAKQELSRLLAPVIELLARDGAGRLYSRRNDEEKRKWTDKKRVFTERARKGGLGKAKKMREDKANKEPASSTLEGMLEPCTSSSPENQQQTPPTPPAAPGGAAREPGPVLQATKPAPDHSAGKEKAKSTERPVAGARSNPNGGNPHLDLAASKTRHLGEITDRTKNGSHPAKAPASPDRRFGVFQAEVSRWWAAHNPKGGECPWIRSDRGALIGFLSNAPSIKLEEFKRLLHNRADSEILPSSPPRKWLRDLLEYAHGPLDRYKKQLSRRVM